MAPILRTFLLPFLSVRAYIYWRLNSHNDKIICAIHNHNELKNRIEDMALLQSLYSFHCGAGRDSNSTRDSFWGALHVYPQGSSRCATVYLSTRRTSSVYLFRHSPHFYVSFSSPEDSAIVSLTSCESGVSPVASLSQFSSWSSGMSCVFG